MTAGELRPSCFYYTAFLHGGNPLLGEARQRMAIESRIRDSTWGRVPEMLRTGGYFACFLKKVENSRQAHKNRLTAQYWLHSMGAETIASTS